MVHALESSLGHDLIHVKYDGCGSADDGIAVGVLKVVQEVAGSSVVVVESLLFSVGGVDEC